MDTELTTKVQGLLEGGTKAAVIQEALAKKYQPDEIKQVMQTALQPKIDGLLAKGVAPETIAEAFKARGLDLVVASPQASAALEQSPAALEAPTLPAEQPKPSNNLVNAEAAPQDALPNADATQPGIDAPLANPDLLPNADATQPGIDAPVKDYGADVANNKPEEMIAKLRNLTFTYEELGSSLAGKTGFTPGLKAKAKEMKSTANAIILKELQTRGIDAVGVNDYGEILVRRPDGTNAVYDDTFIDSMLANKYEIGGSLTGAAVGARVGATAGALAGPVGALVGGAVGGAVGSAVGASSGRGADILTHARDLHYEITTTEVISKMKDAGIADLTLSVLGTTAFQLVKHGSKLTGRGLTKSYDLFIAGNKAGAQQTLKDVFNLNDAQAIDLVTRWEKITGQKALSAEAHATGKLGVKDSDAVLQAVTETLPGAENVVAKATEESKSGGALLSAQIDARAKDITREAANLTNTNIDAVVQDKLGGYVSSTRDYFEQTKTIGTELMKDSGYKFDFAETALVPSMRETAKGIHNSALRKDFYHYMERISELGGKPATTQTVVPTKVAPAAAKRTATLKAAQAKRDALAKAAKARDTAIVKGKALKTVKGKKAALARAKDNFLAKRTQIEDTHLAAMNKVSAEHATATTSKTVETAATPSSYRSFDNLLELRKTINELSSDNRFKSFANSQQIQLAKASVDKEIERAALKHMPEGTTWVKQWKAANTEYSKMKNLEHNVLFKVLTSPRVDPDVAVRAITRSMMYTDPSTFMQVMGKLPAKTRKSVEGAVLKHLVGKHTVGFEAGKQALNLPALATDLEKVAMTQPESRALKRTVGEFADVFKNDPHLLAATGNVPLPKFQSYLTADPIVRAKFEVASTMFNAVKSRIPFSNNAGRAALVKNLGRLLDNPKNAKAVQEVTRALPKDPELKTALHQLAIEFTARGVPEHYGKVPMYRVSKPGEFNKSANTILGKGMLYYTDKTVANSIAKQTGAKVKEVLQLHKRIATPDEITKILGREPSKEELRSPEVLQLLRDKDFAGIAVDDKVMLFK